MAKEKRSFFERLTGSGGIEDYDEMLEDDFEDIQTGQPMHPQPQQAPEQQQAMREEHELSAEEPEGQLTIDMYQTPEAIIIKAVVAGTRPDNLDVSITRDMVTIRGRREESQEITNENYFYRELYWGAFSRTILLPQEVDVEEADAKEKYGMLILTLPKIDKEKQTKLKVKSV